MSAMPKTVQILIVVAFLLLILVATYSFIPDLITPVSAVLVAIAGAFQPKAPTK